MKLRVAIALVGVLAGSCVPATEDLAPRGGVVVRVIPSAETAGKPFTSIDGWTVTIDRVALRVVAYAQRDTGDDGYGYIGGSSYPRIVAPGEACDLKATAIEPGPAFVVVQLASAYADFDELSEPSCGIDADVQARFAGSADAKEAVGYAGPDALYEKPALVVLAHAEKGGRMLRLELALGAGFGFDRGGGEPVTIVPNQGALVRKTVFASALFWPTASEPPASPNDDVYEPHAPYAIRFDDLATADADGNGVITGAELDAVPLPCESASEDYYDDYSDECATLMTAVAEWNAPYMFTPVQ